ncbi:ABC transporter permease [Labrys neptuniae]
MEQEHQGARENVYLQPGPVLSPKLSQLAISAVAPIAAVLVALAFGAVLLWLNGFKGTDVVTVMVLGSFEDVRSVSEILLKATPLILIGAGLCVAFRCSIWNIGAEGQLYVGAIAATVVGTNFDGLPMWVHAPLVMLAGALAGAAWAGIAGYLKVRFRASEIVTTIMLNYLAIILTSYVVTGPLKDASAAYPQSARLLHEAWTPRLVPDLRLHCGILVAIALAIGLYIFLQRSSRGFALRVVGLNPHAARYAGMNVGRNVMMAICISGALAGLAGAFEVAGVTHRLYQNISPGYGFEGIAVALLANNNPLAAIASGVLFATLRSGSEVLQITSQVPQVLVLVIQGVVILSVVAFAKLRGFLAAVT